MSFKVTVDRKKCNGCEDCLEVCTGGMFEMHDGKVVLVEGVECMGCETCIGVCDEGAIAVTATGVALSPTCMNLLGVLDEMDEEGNRQPEGLY